MRRRAFFGALATALAAPVAPRRVYSFLWDNPLVVPAIYRDVELFIGGLRFPARAIMYHEAVRRFARRDAFELTLTFASSREALNFLRHGAP